MRTRRGRIVVLCVNRYGLAFAENKASNTYQKSGLRFSQFYRLACTRCGWAFAGERWKQHRLEDCNSIIENEKRPDWKKYGFPDLKSWHLHGIFTTE